MNREALTDERHSKLFEQTMKNAKFTVLEKEKICF